MCLTHALASAPPLLRCANAVEFGLATVQHCQHVITVITIVMTVVIKFKLDKKSEKCQKREKCQTQNLSANHFQKMPNSRNLARKMPNWQHWQKLTMRWAGCKNQVMSQDACRLASLTDPVSGDTYSGKCLREWLHHRALSGLGWSLGWALSGLARAL